jgi:uncharacterized protein (TIRG00374 family)
MKRIVTTALQITVSLALIAWIFHDGRKRAQIAEAIGLAAGSGTLWWFVPALAAFGVVLLLQTQRWQLLLRALGIRFAWSRTLRLSMIGMFFNFVVPGATGGDIAKIFYAMREAQSEKAAAFLSVVLDRVLGLLGLAFVSALVVAWKFPVLMSTTAAQASLVTIGIILGGAVAVSAAAVVVATRHLENRLPAKMPLRRGILDLAAAIRSYSSAPRTIAAAFALSVTGHLLIFCVFYFAARAFLAGLSLADIFSVMPVINTVTSLPISLQGVGVREQLFRELLGGLYGTPEAVAILVSLGGYLVTVAWNLVGGVVFMFYRPSDGSTASLKDMQAAAEHPAA